MMSQSPSIAGEPAARTVMCSGRTTRYCLAVPVGVSRLSRPAVIFSSIGPMEKRSGAFHSPAKMFAKPEEARHLDVDGTLVDLLRGADLTHLAAEHHCDGVGEGDRLGLVVGDEDRRDAETALQLVQLEADLVTQLRVEVRQRLVEQQHLRLADHGPREPSAAAGHRRGGCRRARRSRPGRRARAHGQTRALRSASGTRGRATAKGNSTFW